MKHLSILLIFLSLTTFAQQRPDSLKKSNQDQSKTAPFSNIKTGPGTNGKDTITGAGVAMAPSSMYFKTKPGKSETIYLTITNDQRRPEQFKISFQDYTMDNDGKRHDVPFGQIPAYGLARFILASPTVVDLRPGEKKKVAITVAMPETEEAYRCSWTEMIVDRMIDRKQLLPEQGSDKEMQMGVIPTYGFAIHIYQNPPNVRLNKVEITKFNFTYEDTSRYVAMKVKNSGDGMGFCKSYVEINNLKTGKAEKVLLKQFVVFPGLERLFEIRVPGKITKGKYSVMLVLDFGSKEQLETAEQEITVN
jgi:hypothetical protein